MKTVLVGASSGLGRCLATGLAERGHQVALLARRYDRLAQAASEIGPAAVPVACDVTDAASCASAVAQAAEAFDGFDSLIYAAGVGPLRRLVDIDADMWRSTFETNVMGAALMTAAAMPHLTEAKGVAAYLSSVSASVTPPWPGLGAYAVTKAALDKLVEAWRGEHPAVAFTRVIVGECGGGQGEAMSHFADAWDPELAGEVAGIWIKREYMSGALLEVQSLIAVLDTVLHCGASATLPSVTIAPRPPLS